MAWPASAAPCVMLNPPRTDFASPVRAVETITASRIRVLRTGPSDDQYLKRQILEERNRTRPAGRNLPGARVARGVILALGLFPGLDQPGAGVVVVVVIVVVASTGGVLRMASSWAATISAVV